MEEEKIRKVLDSLDTGIIILTKNGNVSFANEFCINNSIVKKEFEGKKFYECIRSLEIIGFISDALERKGSERVVKVSDKEFCIKLISSDPLAFEIRDITEKRRLERLQKEFIAGVSHELSTPITAVRNLLELSLEEEKNEELLRKALERVKDLEKIINTVKLLISLEYRQRGIKESVNLKEVINNVIEDLKESIREKRLKVSLEGEDASILGEREKIYILIKNIIENSVKYNREEGEIHIKLFKENSSVILEVKDTGIGIPENEIPLIFTPFFGGKNRKGLGLGLYICKKIADIYNSEIKINSKEGEGTTVTVKFRASQ